MARILAISSYVAYGHVGLGAIVPALQAMEHEVIAVPSVVLSNHYGYEHVGGVDVEVDGMVSILEGIKANGWLHDVDGVITGFLPSMKHAEVVARGLERLAKSGSEAIYLCDPVIGDDPGGLYVDGDLAASIRDQLVPLADIITPNRFELSWLTGQEVGTISQAEAARRKLGEDLVTVATSVPCGEGMIANVLVDGARAVKAVTKVRNGVPHGTGDLFAALYLGHLLDGKSHYDSIAQATAGVRRVVGESLGEQELGLAACLKEAVATAPVLLEVV
ncbi:MAG: pyridoxal kinase [Alphaproteobacteria bacterium]|nr:pyridoxal kinase [Alphaproteobacteria bacterium]